MRLLSVHFKFSTYVPPAVFEIASLESLWAGGRDRQTVSVPQSDLNGSIWESRE